MTANKTRLVLLLIIGALLIGSVFFGLQYLALSKELKELKSMQARAEVNERVVDFMSMFIRDVLQAETEVDFETRLSLENAVRGLKDEEVMTEWQNFIGSRTELEAQNSVKKLLGILVSKIQK